MQTHCWSCFFLLLQDVDYPQNYRKTMRKPKDDTIVSLWQWSKWLLLLQLHCSRYQQYHLFWMRAPVLQIQSYGTCRLNTSKWNRLKYWPVDTFHIPMFFFACSKDTISGQMGKCVCVLLCRLVHMWYHVCRVLLHSHDFTDALPGTVLLCECHARRLKSSDASNQCGYWVRGESQQIRCLSNRSSNLKWNSVSCSHIWVSSSN